MAELAHSLEELIARHNEADAQTLSRMCGASPAELLPIAASLACQLGDPTWVADTGPNEEDVLSEGRPLLRRGEDLGQWVPIWNRTPEFHWFVSKLVRYQGVATALHIVETEDLDRLKRRHELLQWLLSHQLYLTIDELAVRADAFIHYLDQNRESLLATGYPASWFTTWPAPLAVNLYPVRYPRNLLDRRPRDGSGRQFVTARPSLLWCRRVTEGSSLVTTDGRCPDGTVPCCYDDAPLIDSADANDVGRLEEGRAAFFDVKLQLFRRLTRALQRRSAAGLWNDCLDTLTEALLGDAADFYLAVDHRRGAEMPETGQLARCTIEERLPGGLTEVLELIGYVEKELTIGTMDRTKRALDLVIDPDEKNPYLSAIGTARRDQIDAVLDGFEERNAQLGAFWREFQDRVNAALQNEFYEESVVRRRVKRPYAAKYTLRLNMLSDWHLDQLEQTGTLPDLQLSQPKPVSASRFRRVGEIWDLEFDGLAIPVPDSKGLRHMQYLLQRPGQPVHVLELVRAVEGTTATDTPYGPFTATLLDEIGASGIGLGDAGELVDEPARQQLTQHLQELDEDIEEAEKLGNSVHAEELKSQKERIRSYLAGAFGLGGRPRVAGSHQERARTSVRQAIKRTLEEIGAVHPSLRDHLEAISTGTVCCYDPPGNTPPTWEF